MKYSQEEISNRAGIHGNLYSTSEINNPNPDTVSCLE